MKDEKEIELITKSLSVFMRLGIKSVSMDELARQLGISKKTIYKYVKDKEDLMRKAIMLQADQEDEMVASVMAKNLNAIDETFEIMHLMIGMLKQLHPSVIFDMQKYYPHLLTEMMTSRERTIDSCIQSNLEKGQAEGVYREDFDPQTIADLYAHSIEHSFHSLPEEVSMRMSFADRYLELFRYHIRGIASDKGLEYLKDKIKEIKQN